VILSLTAFDLKSDLLALPVVLLCISTPQHRVIVRFLPCANATMDFYDFVHMDAWTSSAPLGDFDTDDDYLPKPQHIYPPSLRLVVIGDSHSTVAMNEPPWSLFEMPLSHHMDNDSYAYSSSNVLDDRSSAAPSLAPTLFIGGLAWHASDEYSPSTTTQQGLVKPEVVQPSFCCDPGCSASFSGTYRRGNLQRHIRTLHTKREPDGAVWKCPERGVEPGCSETDGYHRHMKKLVDKYGDTSPWSCRCCSHWICGDRPVYEEHL